MSVFKCKECGVEVSKEVVELKDLELLEYILPTYRLIDASDAQDSVPEGFYTYDEEKKLYRLNIEESKSQLINYGDMPVGCCGVPWSDQNNLECKNGHKVGRKVSDCYTKHSYYLDPEKVGKKSTKETDIENLGAEELLNILKNDNEQDRKRAAFILVARDKKETLSKDKKQKALKLFEQLIRADSTDNQTKAVLIKALVELDDSRTEILKEKLRESSSKEIRKISAMSFKDPTEQEVIEILIPSIKLEKDSTVRVALAKKISGNSSERVIDKLVNSLSKDISFESKLSIADALGRIRTQTSEKPSTEKSNKAVKQLKKEKQKLEDKEKIQRIEYFIGNLEREIESHQNSRLYWRDYLRVAGWLILYSPWILYNTVKAKLTNFQKVNE